MENEITNNSRDIFEQSLQSFGLNFVQGLVEQLEGKIELDAA